MLVAYKTQLEIIEILNDLEKASPASRKRKPDKFPAFCGTMDGSQGHSFKAVIILTPRTSPFRYSEFIEDDNRIKVTISRTKRICCVIIHGSMTIPGGTWSKLIRKVPSEARTIYSVISARWPQ
ncbi:hypothetical protein B9Z55_027853 [Caenorhabditis nigoni]|uniref:DNA2/NAM7 helicase-like C-terminal domain-containing protein n=1 Tax=Caenorhabditis nigoni TaxID=1611254 RepID=A0A2G5SE40_9PELO|nr:hypothetical protein B9Z55_027853 [Caenorhabditis nigoni]